MLWSWCLIELSTKLHEMLGEALFSLLKALDITIRMTGFYIIWLATKWSKVNFFYRKSAFKIKNKESDTMLSGPSQGLLRALWNLRKSSFTALVSRCAINPCVCTPAGYCDESCSIYNISPLPPPATPDHAYTILSVRVKLETKNQDEMYLVL